MGLLSSPPTTKATGRKVFQSSLAVADKFVPFRLYGQILNSTKAVQPPIRNKSSTASGRKRPSCCQTPVRKRIFNESKLWQMPKHSPSQSLRLITAKASLEKCRQTTCHPN